MPHELPSIGPGARPSRMQILVAVARAAGVTPAAIEGDRRDHAILPARFVACVLMRDYGYSLPQIARRMGGRDHTSIINALRKFESVDRRTNGEASRLRALAERVLAGDRAAIAMLPRPARPEPPKHEPKPLPAIYALSLPPRPGDAPTIDTVPPWLPRARHLRRGGARLVSIAKIVGAGETEIAAALGEPPRPSTDGGRHAA